MSWDYCDICELTYTNLVTEYCNTCPIYAGTTALIAVKSAGQTYSRADLALAIRSEIFVNA